MDLAFQKTLTFILFIGIGLLLKLKFSSKEELTGIKKIILNLALPATIFLALLGINIDGNLLSLPFIALGLNLALFFGFPRLMVYSGIKVNSPEFRTARLLMPSLAPGLSCFPFILEYLGDEYLAKAAMADLGNKVFVLLILYLVAMTWHRKISSSANTPKGTRLRSLFIAMISEPVNLLIILALVLVYFGISIDSFPFFVRETFTMLSVIMTPLVLLFIGLAVRIRKQQFFSLLSLLFLRAGFTLLLSGLVIVLAGISVQNDILLLMAFGLSACSFWPFSHIAVVESQEESISPNKRTFNASFAVNILALSFPFSTLLILGVLTSGSFISNAGDVFLLGVVLLAIGFIPYAVKKIREVRSMAEKQKSEWILSKTRQTEASS